MSKRYWYNTPRDGLRALAVESFGSMYCACWKDAKGNMNRLSTPHLPLCSDRRLAQNALDRYAASRRLDPADPAVPSCSYCGAAPAVKGYADMGTACCDDCSLIPQITNVPESLAAIRSETVPERLIRALRHEEANEKRLGITVPICTRLRVLKSSGLALKRIMEATAT